MVDRQPRAQYPLRGLCSFYRQWQLDVRQHRRGPFAGFPSGVGELDQTNDAAVELSVARYEDVPV